MMALIDEIKAKCSPELLASRDDVAITTKVNENRTKVATTLGGIGTVMEALGPTDGAALLDQLEAMAATVPAVKWAFVLINRGELDFGSAATRGMIDQLIAEPARSALKAVANVPDLVSVGEVSDALNKDAGLLTLGGLNGQ